MYALQDACQSQLMKSLGLFFVVLLGAMNQRKDCWLILAAQLLSDRISTAYPFG